MTSKTAIGIIIIAFGITQIVGSITGNMAGMLGALFDPKDLVNNQGGKAIPHSSGIIGSILGNLKSIPSTILPRGL